MKLIPLKPVIISAPFGNYLGGGNTTATLGTFTVAKRRGRLWRILKTVRYNPFTRSWRNSIGLRNPGLQWLEDVYDDNPWCTKGKIVSVHGFDKEDWLQLFERVPKVAPLAVEFNVSCPNVEHKDSPLAVIDYYKASEKNFKWIYHRSIPVIVKLPPEGYMPIVDYAWDAGIRCFHACNTMKSPKGGVSGKLLKPHSLEAVRKIRQVYPDAQIIGGGGITCESDIYEYFDAGADHIALASCLFFPWNIIKFGITAKRLAKLEA